jgi:hypothetical protein
VVRRITFGSGATPTPTPTMGPTPTPTPTSRPNTLPNPAITTPANGATYKGGDLLSFAGDCTDAEDGTVAAAGFLWDVVFHHNTHTHPGQQLTGAKSGSYSIPTTTEWDPDQWYRVNLTCTDSLGGARTVFRDVLPKKQPITIASNPGGLQVAADGVTGPGPQTADAVVNTRRILDTTVPQSMGGTTYFIQSWSDGGAKRHEIFMPDAPTTYTANFQPASAYSEAAPVAVSASTSDTNVPANATDNNLATRWSGNGDGAWLQLDLGSVRTIGHVNVGVYQGNTRRNRFDLQVSSNASTWTTIFSGESSGTTTAEETFDFIDVSARYVRYLGHGSSVGTFNSVTEVSVFVTSGVIPPTPTPTPGPAYVEITPSGAAVTASTSDGNVPAGAVDNDLATRWSGNGDGAWIQFDLGSTRTVGYLTIATFNGNTRQSSFDLQVSSSASGPWTTVLAGGVTSGTSTAEETFDFPDTAARFVRYLGHGNTVNTWNSLTEVSIFATP